MAAAADKAPGAGEDAQPRPFGFPAGARPGRASAPGEQFAGQGDDLAPDRWPSIVGEPQLRAGEGAFLADDDPHPFRPARQLSSPDPRPLTGADWTGGSSSDRNSDGCGSSEVM